LINPVKIGTRTEKACKAWLRKNPKWGHGVSLSLTVVTGFALCAPLLFLGTTSFQEAGDICRYRKIGLLMATLDIGSDLAAAEFDTVATHCIFPGHAFNSLSSVVALACFVLWLELNPHPRPSAAALDAKLGRCQPPRRSPTTEASSLTAIITFYCIVATPIHQ
jgi:hypothetical protein